MRDHLELFEQVRLRPGMFLMEETYAAVVAFVEGFDSARSDGVLIGFREWLVLRLKKGSNLAWPALVLWLAFPDAKSPVDVDALREDPEAQRVAIETLFKLLEEFEGKVRKRRGGLIEVFVAYDRHMSKVSGLGMPAEAKRKTRE